MNFEKGKALQQKSHTLIPGGSHTYAKGDDQYPELAPAFLVRGKGCHVWDVDGNEFIEYGMGLRAVTLGHAYEPVVAAAHKQMLSGINFTRPAPIEVECAEKLLSLISGGEMVKFAKNGSDVTTAAVKLARAFTGRDRVAVCAEHPFFSVDDWFIGSTPMAAGIPEVVRKLTVKFHYNDLESHGRVDVMADLTTKDAERLHLLISSHARYTGSKRAAEILANWNHYRPLFRKVMPVEYRRALAEMAKEKAATMQAAE